MSPIRRAADKQNEQKNAARPAPARQALAPTAAGARLQRSPESAASPAELLALQGRVGNRAVQNLLATRQIQARLEVGAADDPFEQEANVMADSVMRAPTTDDDQPLPGPVEED